MRERNNFTGIEQEKLQNASATLINADIQNADAVIFITTSKCVSLFRLQGIKYTINDGMKKSYHEA